MTAEVFIKPIDVLFLRGNLLFGAAGSFGHSVMPPSPAVFAGAIRSALLTAKGVNLSSFAKGEVNDPELGTPQCPGRFAVKGFHLARQHGRTGLVERFFSLPADLVVKELEGTRMVQRLQPRSLSPALKCSAVLPQVAILAETSRDKPVTGLWLTQRGWETYLAGGTPAPDALVDSQVLWKSEVRIGIGLSATSRAVEQGKLFSAEAISLCPGVGFVARIEGADLTRLRNLRLGGDGRAGVIEPVSSAAPEPDYEALARSGRMRVVLTTPGLFEDGWRPGALPGELVCAVVPRMEVVSGWDLARGVPKPAQRAVPAGAVYWLEGVQQSADQLRAWVTDGLWPTHAVDPIRRAEGFNRFALAAW